MTIVEQNDNLRTSTKAAFNELHRLREGGIKVDTKTYLKLKYNLRSFDIEDVSVYDIQRTVCTEFFKRTDVQDMMRKKRVEVSIENLRRMMFIKSRVRPLPELRHTFWFLVKKKFDFQYKYIGKISGGRDHSTIIHGVSTYQDLVSTEPNMRRRHEVFCKRLGIDNNLDVCN